MQEIVVIGTMDNNLDHTFESANRVYGVDGIAPTVNTCGGGGLQAKIMEVQKINSDCKTVALRMVRTEEGKRLRKLYEAHEIHHGFNEHRKAEPRSDGVCNTISTVQKDSLVLETTKGIETIPKKFEKFIYEIDGELYLIRIRKLTPRECWRLMGFSDSDYDKAATVNSNTQLYKQAGNSIVKKRTCSSV